MMRLWFRDVLLLCAALVAGTASGDDLGRWEIRQADGNSIAIVGGAARISARLNTHAYIARCTTSEAVTLEAVIRPSSPTGVSWCTSLYLFWDERNWCQFGVTDLNGGPAFYVTEMADGGPQEFYLPRTDAQPEQRLRIELGADCIRYVGASQTLRVVPRPKTFRGAPMVAIGKGYATGKPPYDHPGLANDYADTGPVVVSGARSVLAIPTPASRLRMTAGERRTMAEARNDPDGLAVLRLPGDPTFERVAARFPPFRWPREISGLPGHPTALAIDRHGAMAFTAPTGMQPERWSLRVQADRPLLGHEQLPKRRLAGGWMPAIILSGRSGALTWEQTAFAATPGLKPEGPLTAYVRFRVRAGSKDRMPKQVIVWSEPGPGKPGASVATLPLTPTSDGGATVALRFVAGTDRPDVLPVSSFHSAFTGYMAWWRDQMSRGMQITTPERRVTDGYKTWMAYAMLNTKMCNGLWEVHDGSGFYDEAYGYSVLLHSIACDLYGRHDLSDRYLARTLAVQHPDGLYTENYGLPDMGALLLACAERFRLTRDSSWLKRVAPNIVRAANWISARRAEAPRSGPAKGMILFRPYCDHHAPVYGFYGDTYCCVGLEQAADALRGIGYVEDAQRIETEARQYRADLIANMNASAYIREGRKVMPMEPATQRLLRDAGYRGGHYWGLVASCMLETEFLGPRSAEARSVIDTIERNAGLICGLSEFAGGVDHAYAYGYLLTKLKQGDARRTILGFYSMLAHGMTRDTYAAVECTQIRTGDNAGTLPHTYSSTQQLRLLRMMLTREDGRTLHLGPAIPRHWLKPGLKVKVTNAPTRFGVVGFAMSATRHGDLEARVTLDRRLVPDSIVVHLRHPGGRPPKSVAVDGAKRWRLAGATVQLEDPTETVRVFARYR